MVEKHHFFVYKQGWIDDYGLDCLKRQYRHYQQEGSKQKMNYVLFLENSIKNRVKRSCDNI